MLNRLRSYLRQQHLALLCLFLIVGGGTAWALTNDSVRSRHIKDGQVKTSDLAGAAVTNAKLGPDAVAGANVGTNALGGSDIDESTLFNDDTLNEGDLAAAEAPHEVGAAGEPGFHTNDGFCVWENYDGGGHQSAAFFRDAFGVVHLKGLVKSTTGSCDFSFGDNKILVLPAGYTPAARSVHATLANNNIARINVDPGGLVSVDATSTANGTAYTSLDGITFRCAPAGSNGCP